MKAILAIVLTMCVLPAFAQKSATPLKKGITIERTMAGKGLDKYSLTLPKNQFARLVVDQIGIDVVIRVHSPNGRLVGEFDSPNGNNGPEPVSFFANESGTYRIAVSALDPDAVSGRYKLRVLEVRRATVEELQTLASESEIALAEREWDVANRIGSKKDLDRLMAPDYINISRDIRGANANKSEHIRNSTQAKRTPEALAGRDDFAEVTTRIFGDTAIVSSRITGVAKRAGREERDPFPFRATHLWQKRNGRWRIIADQTFQASEFRQRKVAGVSSDVLKSCAGIYGMSKENSFLIAAENDHLVLLPKTAKIRYYPESESDFFNKAEDRQLTFIRDSQGMVKAVIIDNAGSFFRWPRIGDAD